MALRPTTPGKVAGQQVIRDRAQATPRTTKSEQLRPWDNLITWFLAQLTVPGEIGYGHTVREGRPEDADQLWRELGQPGWDRFGLTVTAERQWIWLDSPNGDHTWPLTGSAAPGSGHRPLPAVRR